MPPESKLSFAFLRVLCVKIQRYLRNCDLTPVFCVLRSQLTNNSGFIK